MENDIWKIGLIAVNKCPYKPWAAAEGRPYKVMSPETAFTQANSQTPLTQDVYDDGYLRVEHRNYYVACDGQSVKLPRTEFLILSRLARTPERIVTAADLWEYAWGKDKPLNTESLHVIIYRLRHKIAHLRIEIETMVNVGYRLVSSGAVPPAG